MDACVAIKEEPITGQEMTSPEERERMEANDEEMCSLIAEVLRAERLRKICSPEVDNTWESVVLSPAKRAVPREGMDRPGVDIGLEDELVRERRV